MNKIDFSIEIASFVCSLEDLDLSFIPPMLKRKLSGLNRAIFYVLNQCYTDNTDKIIYSSQYGEFDKLLKIIDQYNQDGEVSPITFSTSVHNATIGSFLRFKDKPITYQALSAVKQSLSMALFYSLISKGNNTIFCYADYIDKKPSAVALLINKHIKTGNHYILTPIKNNKDQDIHEFTLMQDFINQITNVVEFKNYRIERVADDK